MQCLANSMPVGAALEKSTKLVGYQQLIECYEGSMSMKMLLTMSSKRRRSLLSETVCVLTSLSESYACLDPSMLDVDMSVKVLGLCGL